MELTGLGERVLPDRGVQHEEHFVRGTRTFLSDDARDLAELVHEIRFRVQPAGRIDQHHVHLPCFRGGNPIKGYGGWIGSIAVTDHVDADSVGPDLQLIDRRRAKGIGCHQQRHLPCLHQPLRDLGNRGGLTHTVYPHCQDDERLGAFREQGLQR